ncbi:MAG: hypothetical protein J6N77_05185 [Lachnospiraceae bacterium]|nr:hypothetical protein [Lachnospiraceae bacterium]
MYTYSLNYRRSTEENPYGREKIIEISTPWLPRVGEIVEWQPWDAATGNYRIERFRVEEVETWFQDETRYGINLFVSKL